MCPDSCRPNRNLIWPNWSKQNTTQEPKSKIQILPSKQEEPNGIKIQWMLNIYHSKSIQSKWGTTTAETKTNLLEWKKVAGCESEAIPINEKGQPSMCSPKSNPQPNGGQIQWMVNIYDTTTIQTKQKAISHGSQRHPLKQSQQPAKTNLSEWKKVAACESSKSKQ